MLKREIWNELVKWKERKHHPLIIKGLRQVGKTFIVRKFGEEYYKNTVYIDLRSNKTIHKAFSEDFDVNQMILYITANISSARFIEGKTLLILDEIQDCPNARSSLKYWDKDGRFDVIATGSFLGVKGFRTPYERGIPVGCEEQMIMYPLSFREFLDNQNLDISVIKYVEGKFKEKKKIDDIIHASLRNQYLRYLIVGGMPEVVEAFFHSYDLNRVRDIQRNIISSIKDDFGRYRDKNGNDMVNETLKLRAEAALDSIPSQLAKEYKKFQYSLVDVKGKANEKAEGLDYIVDVGLVYKAYNTREISYPLEGAKNQNEFKVYYADTGLLISQLDSDTPGKILSGDLGAYKGAITENMVAVSFIENGINLYYYHHPTGSPELDFLIEEDGNVTIVESKSSNGRATSMKFVLANPNRFGHHNAIKIADSNVGETSGYTTYPLYYLGFLPKRNKEKTLAPIDLKNIKAPVEE